MPVTVAAASLNMHDIWTLRGVGIKPEQFPMILGCDGAGTLADGSHVVLHSIIGDPAWFGDETLDPQRNMLTEKHQGTFADTVVVPARNAVPHAGGAHAGAGRRDGHRVAHRLPDDLLEVGSAAGQTMLVQGATGGVSTALIQLGRAAGMRVWVTGRTQEKRDVAERLGAHATFPTGARLPERVDAVFETVGEATWAHSMRALKPGGVIVVSGSTSGPDAERRPAAAVLPAAPGDRLHHGHPGRAGGPARVRREHGDHPGDRARAADGEGEEGFRAMLDGDTAGKIVFTR